MARSRIEDLGRISERLHDILDHEVFEGKNIDQENLEGLHHLIEECWLIARFGDEDECVK